MKKFYRLIFVIGIVIALMNMVSLGWTFYADKFTRATLRGLKGVWIQIDKLEPEIEKDGLTRNQIQTDVELKLRIAGIKVLTREEWVADISNPSLHVSPAIVKTKKGRAYVYYINIELNQRIFLERDPNIIAIGCTWSGGVLGMTHSIIEIRDNIKDNVDKFINAYLTVNPK